MKGVMIDDLILLISNKNLERYCRKVVENYIENSSASFKNLIQLYSRLETHSDHVLVQIVANRISSFDSCLEPSKEIVDLYLMLFFNCKNEFLIDANKMKLPAKQKSELQNHNLMYLIQVASLRCCRQYAFLFFSRPASSSVSCNKVKLKYRNDAIWELWNEIVNTARSIGHFATVFCTSQLQIFQTNYDKSAAKKRSGIVLGCIDVLYACKKNHRDLNSETNFTISDAHVECMLKINLLYRELDHLNAPSLKEYLYDIAMYR